MSEQFIANNHKTLGWREWVALPNLGIRRIKAKIDTGARTSSLHALSITICEHNPQRINFAIYPLQHNARKLILCEEEIVDLRWITDSGGNREQRYVIRTPVLINEKFWPIEITLTERDNMSFRMLLGRSAIRQRFVVNPAGSFLQPKPSLCVK